MQAVLLVFKVVHDPADAALKQRKDITKKVEDAVLDEVIDAIGAKIGKVGKTVGAMSGSAGLVNPNLIMEYKHAQVPQARALGATMPLDEDLVALIHPRAASSAGLVLIHLTVKADKHAPAILAAIQAMLHGEHGPSSTRRSSRPALWSSSTND